MKKFLCIFVSIALVLGLSGFSTKAAAPKKSYYIGFSTMTTQGDFMSMLATELQKRFTKLGDKFEVASADLSASKQIEQIENFITLGVDEIIIMAVDPSSLADVIKKAQSKGIKIVAFSQKTPTYDVFIGSNEGAVGANQAQMAAKWIDATFPKAAPGSIQVGIFENRDKPTAAERSNGLRKITQYTKKAKIAKIVGVDTTTNGGQSAAENLMLTNPKVKVILCYNGDTAMGVDAYAMALNSTIKDKAHFATFGVDYNQASADAITKSSKNKSVWRGTIMMGKSLEAMFQDIMKNSTAVLDGTLKKKDVYAELFQITVKNVASAGK
jgi:ribose transport system substrate-binding protein